MYTQIELCACNLFRLERVQRKTTVLLREVAKVFPHSMTQNAKCAAEKFQLNVYSCDAEKFNYYYFNFTINKFSYTSFYHSVILVMYTSKYTEARFKI